MVDLQVSNTEEDSNLQSALFNYSSDLYICVPLWRRLRLLHFSSTFRHIVLHPWFLLRYVEVFLQPIQV